MYRYLFSIYYMVCFEEFILRDGFDNQGVSLTMELIKQEKYSDLLVSFVY